MVKELGTEVIEDAFSDKFEAALLRIGKKCILAFNKQIREEGRKYFCIWHNFGYLELRAERRLEKVSIFLMPASGLATSVGSKRLLFVTEI